ncbi:MAG TPA: PA4780 family RIO1-like protein kinase [Acidiferrobacteraceae bacterium]|nr:PA4780 family RIO1-like protein kinase [Acidiferrobacteraceae bacterium]
MKIPKRLQPLLEDGLIDAVLRPLKSGKEAAIFVVSAGGDIRCAKVYKDVTQRGFHKAALYQEGRVVRNTRRARAMENGTRYGRREQEDAWQTTEVRALHRLADAGVRVPRPYNFLDGVLLMELIVDGRGNAAPRLADLDLSEAEAIRCHRALMTEVARMLCAGVVHGDLSEYNILMDAEGQPVIIDLPQTIDASANNNAPALFIRDIDHLAQYFGRFAPALTDTDYGREIWALYKSGSLRPDTTLTGHYRADTNTVDVSAIMREIDAAREEELARRARLQGD